MNDPIDFLAQQFCKITYPDKKGGCLYTWDLMAEEHREQFRQYARFTAKLVMEAGDIKEIK